MENCDAFTRAFLPTLRITQKSQFLTCIYEIITHLLSRVLLASIRNKGGCPCPRCLIPLERLQNLGEPQDRHQRITLQRVNDARYLGKISDARKWIYGTKNKTIKSKYVEDLLKEDSWVPTSVSTKKP